MVERAVNNYYKFFDETLQSSTFLVLIVVMLIFMIGAIVPNANAEATYMKGNLLEMQQVETQKNIVEIDGVIYELQFLRVK
jgi:hypothetical protein